MPHSSPNSDLEPLTGELARLVERAAPLEGLNALLPFAWAYRASGPTPPAHTVYTPVLCVMARGRKQVLVGEDRFIYDTQHFFLASVTVPVACQVLDATPARPCLSMAIALEPATIASVIAEAGLPQLRATPSQRALDSCRMTAPLLDAVVRLATQFRTARRRVFKRRSRCAKVFSDLMTRFSIDLKRNAVERECSQFSEKIAEISQKFSLLRLQSINITERNSEHLEEGNCLVTAAVSVIGGK